MKLSIVLFVVFLFLTGFIEYDCLTQIQPEGFQTLLVFYLGINSG